MGETLKAYLGDAVYVYLDEHRGLVLTTEDGYRATNTIVLEPEVMLALLAFWRRCTEPQPGDGGR